MEYGLLGKQLSHSFSKEIHEMLKAYEYDLCPVAPEDLPQFMTQRNFKGLNVTIPYKQEVMKYLDVIDPLAQEIGAVNTIYFKNGKMHGTNTDYTGFQYMAALAGIDFKNKKVLIAGTGGASLMVQKAAADMGAARISVASRKGPITYDKLPQDTEIFVNTTPVGTWPDNGNSPADLSQFKNLEGVLDLIYNPSKTALLLQAEELGLKFTNGLSMLVAQATAAGEFFTGNNSFQKENRRILSYLQKEISNIVLVGMPGSGKTSLGQLLAEALSLHFVDIDLLIEQRTGKQAGEIINEKGEEYFREIESKTVAEITASHGNIIATGGGAILNESNRRCLRQNGPVIFIERDLNSLSTEGRPLSKNLEEMYKKRLPLYKSCSDFSVTNDGTPEEALSKILAILTNKLF